MKNNTIVRGDWSGRSIATINHLLALKKERLLEFDIYWKRVNRWRWNRMRMDRTARLSMNDSIWVATRALWTVGLWLFCLNFDGNVFNNFKISKNLPRLHNEWSLSNCESKCRQLRCVLRDFPSLCLRFSTVCLSQVTALREQFHVFWRSIPGILLISDFQLDHNEWVIVSERRRCKCYRSYKLTKFTKETCLAMFTEAGRAHRTKKFTFPTRTL